MATKYKGKYFGPDVFKGKKSTHAAWKAAGSPDPVEWFKTYKPDTRSKYEKQADELADKQYAGTLTELKMGRDTNKRTYDTETTRRKTALSGELASNETAGQITQNTIQGLKGEALAQFLKAKADRDAISAVANEATKARNTSALTQFQEQMRARGIDPGNAAQMVNAQQTQQEYSGKLDQIAGQAATGQEGLARQLYDLTTTQAAGQKNRASSQAQSAAQRDLTTAYQTYASKDAELAGTLAKTQLDKGSTAAQTALTLKKEAQLRAQEKAQLALERHVAGLKNAQAMAKVASSDYFKEAGLQLKAADLKLKGKALDAKIAQQRRSGNLGEAKLLEQIRSNMAKERVNEAKAGVKYNKPANPNTRITSPSNPKR